jgi:hypothetical protein
MIPKIIHYCWFGGNPLSELAQKCIESWKKFCPDYEIVRWDESNFDVNQNSTNFISCSYTQIQPSETNINKFLESKYEAFDFAPIFETHCLNIIQPDSIGFQELEEAKLLFNKANVYEKLIHKEEYDMSSSQSNSSQFNSSSIIRKSSLNSEELYNDDYLSQAFSSCLDD